MNFGKDAGKPLALTLRNLPPFLRSTSIGRYELERRGSHVAVRDRHDCGIGICRRGNRLVD